MVRIKKEKYEKLQKKREKQLIEEAEIQQRISHLNHWNDIYLEDILKQCFINPITDVLDTNELINECQKGAKLIRNNIAGVNSAEIMTICHSFVEFIGAHRHHDDYLDLPEFFGTCYFGRFNNAIFEGIQLFFSKESDINSLFIDLSDASFDNKFYIFEIFEKARSADIVFIKNLDYNLWQFLINYGIENCCSYIFFFFKDELEILKIDNDFELDCEGVSVFDKKGNKKNNNEVRGFQISQESLLCNQHGMAGFELYDNLKEWKKEVVAPTRNSPEYKKMKKRVRQRDGNTCQCCGYYSNKKTHHNLEVHHIYGYKDHLDYRTEDSNCITLCSDCHKKYHSLYGKKNVTPFTFIQFIKEYRDYYETDFQTTLDTLEVI